MVGYMYAVWVREFRRSNEMIFKPGRTEQDILDRIKAYAKGTVLITCFRVDDCALVERLVLARLRNTPNIRWRKDIGNEYFQTKDVAGLVRIIAECSHPHTALGEWEWEGDDDLPQLNPRRSAVDSGAQSSASVVDIIQVVGEAGAANCVVPNADGPVAAAAAPDDAPDDVPDVPDAPDDAPGDASDDAFGDAPDVAPDDAPDVAPDVAPDAPDADAADAAAADDAPDASGAATENGGKVTTKVIVKDPTLLLREFVNSANCCSEGSVVEVSDLLGRISTYATERGCPRVPSYKGLVADLRRYFKVEELLHHTFEDGHVGHAVQFPLRSPPLSFVTRFLMATGDAYDTSKASSTVAVIRQEGAIVRVKEFKDAFNQYMRDNYPSEKAKFKYDLCADIVGAGYKMESQVHVCKGCHNKARSDCCSSAGQSNRVRCAVIHSLKLVRANVQDGRRT